MKISQKAIPGELFVLNEFKVAVSSEKVFLVIFGYLSKLYSCGTNKYE